MNLKSLGKWGEEKARDFLEKRGFDILEENFRCPLGEIDLIGKKGDYLVFIEVKTRRSTAYGLPVESIDRKKQIRYGKLAQYYIMVKKLHNISCRFDVVEIRVCGDGKFSVNHISNAFYPPSGRFSP